MVQKKVIEPVHSQGLKPVNGRAPLVISRGHVEPLVAPHVVVADHRTRLADVRWGASEKELPSTAVGVGRGGMDVIIVGR